MNLVLIAFAPVLIIGLYVYYRDKHEKEPMGMLLRTFLMGALITIPIIFVEQFLDGYWKAKFMPAQMHVLTNAAYVAFVVAALTEELFKYMALMLFWRNRHINELFDGIVYAVLISLGFAAVENVLYVAQHGASTGILRALTAVPAHALFGVSMGYYFGIAKFFPAERTVKLILALLVPLILHGIYDFILMAENVYFLVLFIPFIVYLWIVGFRRMKRHSEASVFKK